MKNDGFTVLFLIVISLLGNKMIQTLPSEEVAEINFHVLYILGIHIGSLEYAAHADMSSNYVSTIVGYAIGAADESNCVSSTSLKTLKKDLLNSGSSKIFEGRIRNIREQLNREIAENCICLSSANSNVEVEWYWPVENAHVWNGLSMYQIRELGYNEEVYQGSMTWGWKYYLKDPNGQWLRIDGSKVYYVNWDKFKTLYTFKYSDQYPNDPKLERQDYWVRNSDGSAFNLIHLEKNLEWYNEVESTHPFIGKSMYVLRNSGYKEVLYHGSSTWGWTYYLKDSQGRWVRLSNGKVYYVNWDIFKKLYTFNKTEKVNSSTVSHKDYWKHNKTGKDLTFFYTQ